MIARSANERSLRQPTSHFVARARPSQLPSLAGPAEDVQAAMEGLNLIGLHAFLLFEPASNRDAFAKAPEWISSTQLKLLFMSTVPN
jgi:hypothetical protein